MASSDGNPARNAMIFGLICLPVGLAVGGYFGMNAAAAGWQQLVWYAALGALLAPTLVWWLLVERRGARPGAGRAALAGLLGAAGAHYLCWYAWMLGVNLDYHLLGGPGSSLGEAPMDPLNGLWGALVFTAYSYVFVGWITLPAGALLGLAARSLLHTR